ncbi:MAG TPA: TetR/AcrR family transcriptional regulator [Sphingobium sp.]|nr:TetR/AcrR family transcriptional regulator [Sphingobium sp.]
MKAGSAKAAAPRRARRRGRPTADDVAAIDEALQEAAQIQFLQAGYEAATMDSIAATAAVSKGTLYARYATKEALFRSVVKSQFAALDKRASQENHRLPVDFERRLRWHAGTLVNSALWPEYKIFCALINSASTTFPDMAQLRYEIGAEATVKFLAGDMSASFDGPDREKIDWQAYAIMIVNSIGGWYLAESSVREVPLDEATALCEKTVRVVLGSLRHEPLYKAD